MQGGREGMVGIGGVGPVFGTSRATAAASSSASIANVGCMTGSLIEKKEKRKRKKKKREEGMPAGIEGRLHTIGRRGVAQEGENGCEASRGRGLANRPLSVGVPNLTEKKETKEREEKG